MKILIVDDSTYLRSIIKKMFEGSDCEVIGEAENAEKAMKLNKQFLPDVITLDISMPEKTGIEILPNLLKINPKTKIIMISVMGKKELVINAIRSGAKGFVVKPFNREILLTAIKKTETIKQLIQEALDGREYLSEDLQTISTDIPKYSEILKDLSEQANLEPDEAKKILDGFVSDIPNILSNLKASLSTQDYEKVGEISHKLIGIISMFKLNNVEKIAMELEKHSLKKDVFNCEKYFSQLNTSLENMKNLNKSC